MDSQEGPLGRGERMGDTAVQRQESQGLQDLQLKIQPTLPIIEDWSQLHQRHDNGQTEQEVDMIGAHHYNALLASPSSIHQRTTMI